MMIRASSEYSKIATVKDVVNRGAQKAADPMKKMAKEEAETTEEEVVATSPRLPKRKSFLKKKPLKKSITLKKTLTLSSVVKNSPKNSEKRAKVIFEALLTLK